MGSPPQIMGSLWYINLLAGYGGTVVTAELRMYGVPRPGRHSFAPTFHHSQHQSPWWHRDEMSTTISRQPDVQWKQTKDHLKGIYTDERNMMLLHLFLLILSCSDKQKRMSCCCCCYHEVSLVFDVSLSICRLQLRFLFHSKAYIKRDWMMFWVYMVFWIRQMALW